MPVRTQPRLPNLNASALTLRDRLMGAALSLFSEFGFHGVAVPKIAKAAGIATGSIYSYFSSKEDLANELFWTWKLQLKSYYLTDYPAAASIEDQFCFIWARLHSYADDYPEAFQFIEGQLHASYLSDKCLKLEEEVFEIGRSFFRRGQAQGEIRGGDPQLLVAFFFGAFVQYFKDTHASRQNWNLTNSELIRDLCWTSLKTQTLG